MSLKVSRKRQNKFSNGEYLRVIIIAHYAACDWLRGDEMEVEKMRKAFGVVYMDGGVSK